MERKIYVWISLVNRQSGIHENVPAGLLKLSIEDGRVQSSTFRYGRKYLERSDKIAIDISALPLKNKEHRIDATKFDIFTGIKDACPDSWGRAVMEKRAGRQMREDEFLMASSEFRVGALSFSENLTKPQRATPWDRKEEDDQALNLKRVFKAYEAYTSDDLEQIEKSLKAFIMPGSSLGGARPKANCVWKDDLWIAKFQRANDSFDYVRVEYATMNLARQCGLNIPETDLQVINGKSIFLIRRFDRQLTTQERKPFNSALAVLEETELSFMHSSYMDIADAIVDHSRAIEANLTELYKRMLFNAFVNNNDDHLRNHGFLYDYRTDSYELSPAYDIVPMNDVGEYGRRLSIKCSVEENGERTRNISKKGLLRAASAFRLSEDDARAIYGGLHKKIENLWRPAFKDAKVKTKDIEAFEAAFLKGDL